MKVLITGGYGFIGSHVAERFYKEGHDVYIIDNLITGKKENITFKHKFYHLSIEDPKCEDLFASYQFDVVVHLAAQVSVAKSMQNPIYDAQSNIVGLIQMLKFATEYKVKKFIFSSSAAVYGEQSLLPINEEMQTDPISPYGLSKLIGEKYCQNWASEQGLETICFRFSNVYGPRQTAEGEGGVVSIFLDRILNNNTLQIHGDGSQTRDFIYVGDIAYAIYQASQSAITGIYNLSTNTNVSVNDLVRNFKSLHSNIATVQAPSREGDIKHSVLNNKKIKNDLGWLPKYSLKEGIEKTYEWGKSRKPSNKQIAKDKRDYPLWFTSTKKYLEILIIFLVIVAFSGSIDIPVITIFDVCVIYIVLIGAIYGNSQAIFAVCLSIGLLIVSYLRQGREIIALMYDTTFFFQLSILIFIGIVIGYSVERKNIKIIDQKERLSQLQTRYNFLETIHDELREVKDELQSRILHNEDSFGKIYSIIQELNEVEPEKIFTNTIEVVQKIMKCKDVSIYIVNEDESFLRMVASSDLLNGKYRHSSLKVADNDYLEHVICSNQIYFNRNLQQNAPVMAAAISQKKKIKAILTIDGLHFSSISNYHENLFKVVVGLIETSLNRAFEYVKITEGERYIGESNILKADVFYEILNNKKHAKEKYNMPYELLKISVEKEQQYNIAKKAKSLLRETDYIGFIENDLYIILSNTIQEDIPLIVNRFNKAGIKTNVQSSVLV